MKCLRCGCKEFEEVDCGPDGYEDDITYISEICKECGLYHSGWTDKWLVDCDTWKDEEESEEFDNKNEMPILQ